MAALGRRALSNRNERSCRVRTVLVIFYTKIVKHQYLSELDDARWKSALNRTHTSPLRREFAAKVMSAERSLSHLNAMYLRPYSGRKLLHHLSLRQNPSQRARHGNKGQGTWITGSCAICRDYPASWHRRDGSTARVLSRPGLRDLTPVAVPIGGVGGRLVEYTSPGNSTCSKPAALLARVLQWQVACQPAYAALNPTQPVRFANPTALLQSRTRPISPRSTTSDCLNTLWR
jgi:hypothetical protein